MGIGRYAFSDCGALKGVSLPNSLSYLGKFCFDFEGVSMVEYRGSEEEWLELLPKTSLPADGCWEGPFIATYNGTVVFHPDEPAPLYGDINGDAEITSDDAVYLLNHTLFPETYPLSCSADFDRDKTITSDDAVYLLNYTLFPDSYPLTEE